MAKYENINGTSDKLKNLIKTIETNNNINYLNFLIAEDYVLNSVITYSKKVPTLPNALNNLYFK